MRIIAPTSQIKYHSAYPILDKNGSAISSSYYTIEQFTFEEVTWVSKFDFSVTASEDPEVETTTFDEGDEIVFQIDGFSTKNIISQVNTEDGIYRCNKVISPTITTLKVKKKFCVFHFTGLTEDEYYFNKSNETFYCSSRHASVVIPYNILVLRNANLSTLLKENETEGYNNEADNSLYSDLSYLGNPYKVVDLGVYRELKIKKILSLVELSKYKDSNNNVYTNDYINSLKSAVNNVKIDDKGSIEVKKSLYNSWNISYGLWFYLDIKSKIVYIIITVEDLLW